MSSAVGLFRSLPIFRYCLDAAPRRCGPFFWLALFGLLTGTGQSQAVSVIVNRSISVSELSVLELRDIYTLRRERWDSGTAIQVFVLPHKDPIHQRFSKNLLQALPHQLQAIWYRLVYSGMGRAPVEVRDEQEMARRVGQTRGAIGYVGEFEEFPNVRVINVES